MVLYKRTNVTLRLSKYYGKIYQYVIDPFVDARRKNYAKQMNETQDIPGRNATMQNIMKFIQKQIKAKIYS